MDTERSIEPEFRAGFVAIAGRPNVGKSTLMNALVGAKLSAVSRKPQTTRDQIKGILTRSDCQIVFVDTPGLIQPRDRFNEYLVEKALEALADVDLLYHLVEADAAEPPGVETASALERVACPTFLVINKIDRLAEGKPSVFDGETGRYDAAFRISALTGHGLEALLAATVERLPVHPPYYNEDDLTDRDMRFLVGEIVREKLFDLTEQEIPYAIATQVDEFKERVDGKHFIRVVIFVEHESQKGVVIGASGNLLKKVGQLARADVEALIGHPVFLQLWVKVRKNWRKKDADLRRLGYASTRGRKRGRQRKTRSPGGRG